MKIFQHIKPYFNKTYIVIEKDEKKTSRVEIIVTALAKNVNMMVLLGKVSYVL